MTVNSIKVCFQRFDLTWRKMVSVFCDFVIGNETRMTSEFL